MSRRNRTEEVVDAADAASEGGPFGFFPNAVVAEENITQALEGRGFIDQQPGLLNDGGQPNISPLEMLRTARNRGVQHELEFLLRISTHQESLPSKHFFGKVEWPCEMGTDDKVKEANRMLRTILVEATTGESLGETDFFYTAPH